MQVSPSTAATTTITTALALNAAPVYLSKPLPDGTTASSAFSRLYKHLSGTVFFPTSSHLPDTAADSIPSHRHDLLPRRVASSIPSHLHDPLPSTAAFSASRHLPKPLPNVTYSIEDHPDDALS